MTDTEVNYAQLVKHGQRATKQGHSTKEFPALLVKSIDAENHQITALASSGAIDRQGEIILPEAFTETLPEYMKNPVVLAAHQHRLESGHSSVVGNVIKAWIDKRGLWVVIEFEVGTELGAEYWVLYSNKRQRAFSVGFDAIEWKDEIIEGKRVRVYIRVELYEISCVAVPANPEALSKAKQKKADFIAAKKEERILREFIPEYGPEFEKECEEFGRMLLTGPTDDELQAADKAMYDAINGLEDDFDTLDCVKTVSGSGDSDTEVAVAAVCDDDYSVFFE